MTDLLIGRATAACAGMALLVAGLSGCAPDARAQLAPVVQCLQQKGWSAKLDPNELAYGAETTASQDFEDYQADDAACR